LARKSPFAQVLGDDPRDCWLAELQRRAIWVPGFAA
jgi:hypothetical protein